MRSDRGLVLGAVLCPCLAVAVAAVDRAPSGVVIARSAQATPSPELLHDVQVSGDVVALGTPVSAYILVHPSDGRCPWSHPMFDGYRSGDSGRFERTCSDARLGSKIDVLVVDDAHELWRRPFRVESDESGPKPIEVRAVLTPKPTPAGATPSPTPHDELNWTSWSGHVRGVGRTPLPWASVSLQGGTCLSPVHTDDQGRFEIICYGGHGLYTIWRMAVLADGYKPWEKSWRLVDFRQPLNIDLVPQGETTTPTPEAWPQTYLPVAVLNVERETLSRPLTAPARTTGIGN